MDKDRYIEKILNRIDNLLMEEAKTRAKLRSEIYKLSKINAQDIFNQPSK